MEQLQTASKRVVSVAKKPIVKRTLIGLAILVVLFGLLGYFVLPGIIKDKAEELISEKLHRKATIEAIQIKPFSLEATIRGAKVLEPDGSAVFVSFDELYADLQSESIIRMAPVVRELRLTRPYVHLVHEAGPRYNISDILALIESQPPSDEPARYSISNILIDGGRIEFDDRPEKVLHTVEDLLLGIPFISNLPTHVEVFVEPALSAKVDGAPLALLGKVQPFGDTPEATVNLDYDSLDLTRFYNYLPFEPGFKVPSAKLDLHLNASFQQPKDAAPRLVIKGTSALKVVELTSLDDKPLIKLPLLDVVLGSAEVFAKRIDVTRVALHSPEVDVVQDKGGGFNLLKLAPPPAKPPSDRKTAPGSEAKAGKPEATAGTAAPALDLRVGEIAVEGAVIRLTDEVPAKPFSTVIDKLDITVKQFSLPGSKPATVELSAHSAAGESLRHSGEFTLQPLAASGDLQAAGVAPARYLPHYVSMFAGELEKGSLAASAKYSLVTQADGQPEFQIRDAAATLSDLAVRLPGDKRPVITVESLGVARTSIDLAQREVRVGEVSSKNARFAIVRGKDGSINLTRLAQSAPPAAAGAAKPAEEPATGDSPTDKPFAVSVERVDIDKWSARLEDQTMAEPVVTVIDPLSVQAQALSNTPGSRAKVDLKARINKKGVLAAGGTAGALPLHANLKLDLKGVDLLPLQPYFTDLSNVLVTSAALTSRGTLTLDEAKDGAFKGGFRGELNVSDMASIDKTNSNDFLKWKSLSFGGVDVKLSPFSLAIDEIALGDFYSRVIVSPEGRINLQDVVRGKDEQSKSVTGDAPAQEAKPADKTAEKPAQESASAPAAQMPPVRIAKLTLQGGQVNFTDNFIKPNYTANLMELGGSVTGLSSDAATAADVDLRGQVNNAPLSIVGKVNPLKGDLALDLKADVKGMELAPLTPYSGKYVGYGIEKGKLSFDVNYKVENRKLTAQNRLVLDQLSFGEKIDSPTATKLPVQLAVALLRDRNGVIDINLPISGSLDDPQFSVGGIIVKVIVNVITKAVTAPFALLGSLFGGGEELSYVEFEAGRHAISEAGEAKLKSLAKALNDRPALKLEIAGRADPQADREGLRRASINRKVRALKLNDTVKKGESVDPASIAVTPEEYPELLKRVYKDEKFPRPRNVIGFLKDVPVEEMEKLMITNAQVTDDDIAALATQRAQVVKDWLVKKGQVPQDRVFLLASKSGPGSAKEQAADAKDSPKAKASRVDFSLK
ncbi:MAG: DUF748 domain-containing protein [Sterolibacteriaceae bacterium]|nr:DUF748 domain-containing protein [Sterolibacteriaceae bacterium]